MSYLAEMEKHMTEGQKRRLRSVWAPVTVAVPPSNAWCNLCVMPDGEIRHYGRMYGERVYLSSRDAGLSWQIGDVEDPRAMCAALRLRSGRWISSFYVEGEGGWQNGEMPEAPPGASGWMALLSDEGPGGAVRWVKISDLDIRVPRFPLELQKRHRVLITANLPGEAQRVAVALSDDDGETWKTVLLESAPPHRVSWPHESVRWQNGSCEASIVERSDGSLLLIARTSLDCHYCYESFDAGETWSAPKATDFNATLTMPAFLKLESGAILLFFCNTQPLPEMDKSAVWPPLNRAELEGRGEDVFTNRDANHAAISFDDGRTWRGFRELYLTDIRNEADFRTRGGSGDSLDKSVHQFQALELPFGKVLLAFGQHAAARRMIVFDPQWLLEESREENLRTGLIHLSTHVYYKSVSGNRRTPSGHCAWNRRSGAILLPDPDGNYEEALYLHADPDERLYTPLQGAVWNYPAAKKGEIVIRLRAGGEGMTISLTDRWFNPCDRTAGAFAAYRISLSDTQCAEKGWSELVLRWDETACEAVLNGKMVSRLAPQAAVPHGLNYLIIQSAPYPNEKSGSYVKSIAMRAVGSDGFS